MAAIDLREALRFIASGGASTLFNLVAVAVARLFMPYDVALLCGIAAGISSSYLLTKMFAFRAREWASVGGEAARFLAVYGFGTVLYFLTAVFVRAQMVAQGADLAISDFAGVIAGAAVMTVTGYFGHRYFTYRTAKGGAL